MLSKADLDAAAADGIVTVAQAEALWQIAARRERLEAASLGHEERFRFMRGFNDFFFAIGIVLLAISPAVRVVARCCGGRCRRLRMVELRFERLSRECALARPAALRARRIRSRHGVRSLRSRAGDPTSRLRVLAAPAGCSS